MVAKYVVPVGQQVVGFNELKESSGLLRGGGGCREGNHVASFLQNQQSRDLLSSGVKRRQKTMAEHEPLCSAGREEAVRIGS